MMRIYFGLIILLLSFAVHAQPTCCAHQDFAALGNDGAFLAKHEQPLPFQLDDPAGQMITFETPDGKQGSAYALFKPGAGTKYLFVFHEWWGLNDYVKKESERLFQELQDTHVIAIDLYDGQVASTREDAAAYMQALTTERATSIIRGAIDYADMLSQGKAEMATIGWCMGGGWSLQAGILAGDKKQGRSDVLRHA
jgi:carboxymethylenebutenolidase